MASKRKKNLPPWLSGVTVKTGTKDSSEVEKDIGKEDNMGKRQRLELEDTVVKRKPRQDNLKVKDGRTEEENMSVEKLVEMSYAEFTFSGSLVYSHNKDDCNIICEDIISEIGDTTDHPVGFDTEWPLTYQKGKQAPTALIQLCLDVDKCYLFHISCMTKLPQMLKKLIEMKNIKKVGMNIENDLWKLEMDYNIDAKQAIQNSTVELKSLANKKLRSAQNWSLEGLTKNVLHLRISKDPKIRTCDWRQYPLPEEQQRYAATDAIISLMLYRKLTCS